MKPVNIGGHPAYQKRLVEQLMKYYPDAVSSLDSASWSIMEQFWNLDLSSVDLIMQDRYSVFGPEPRLPSDMLRSYLLSMKFKVTSLTAWASALKQNHLYAIFQKNRTSNPFWIIFTFQSSFKSQEVMSCG